MVSLGTTNSKLPHNSDVPQLALSGFSHNLVELFYFHKVRLKMNNPESRKVPSRFIGVQTLWLDMVGIIAQQPLKLEFEQFQICITF